MISNLQYLPGLGNSDHVCLSFDLNCYTTITDDTPRPNYNKADYKRIRQSLDQIDWEGELRDRNFSDAWNFFEEKLEAIMEECIPMSKPRSKRKNIYVTREAMKLKKKKYHLWKKYTETQDYLDYARYCREKKHTPEPNAQTHTRVRKETCQ